MATVFSGKRTWFDFMFKPLEKLCYSVGRVNPTAEMNWTTYAKALLLFNFIGFIVLFLLQITQSNLPLNHEHMPNVSWDLAFNTAISFVTNTNWQAYAGESTFGYLIPMVGLTVQNFLSAATGMCVLLCVIRGITRKSTELIGNFWVDLVRTIVYVLLPLSIILSVALMNEGVIQTLSPYEKIQTIEGKNQTIPLGPVASQIAIKQLGTNGGGYFNANSAHPFENPTGVSNFLETFAILLLPAALTYTFGSMVYSRRHGFILFIVMSILFISTTSLSIYSESQENPVLAAFPVLEGKESRFGINDSVLWSVATTATANGSVNCMHSSLSPISGGICLFNIMIGELIFGGKGVGLASMIMFVMLTVFLSGLMVGRTPEYLGKKIEKREIQWVTIAVLTPGLLILLGAGFTCILPEGISSIQNRGPHGLSEILYAFASCAGNNGSSFAGLNVNTPYFNIILGIVMLLARLAIIIPSLAVAGLLAQKRITPTTLGTFSVNSPLFVFLLISVILIIGALTFFPALALGPIIEQFLMLKGKAF